MSAERFLTTTELLKKLGTRLEQTTAEEVARLVPNPQRI